MDRPSAECSNAETEYDVWRFGSVELSQVLCMEIELM